MRKVLLFAVAFCCMMSATAQKQQDKTPEQQLKEAKQKVERINRATLGYTERVDSLVYSNGEKKILQYDQNLNCTKVSMYEMDETGTGWVLSGDSEYEYDAQNRIVSIIYIDPTYGYKETYDYDADGRLSREHYWSQMDDGSWVEIHYTSYEYDAAGNETVVHMYGWDDTVNAWYEMQKNEYTYEDGLRTVGMVYDWDWDTQSLSLFATHKYNWYYNAQRLCTKDERSYLDSESNWKVYSRIEYVYDGHDNVTQEISSFGYGDDFGYSWKTEYEYDSHNNVTSATEYRYQTDYWVLDETTSITYDLTVPAYKIAGYTIVIANEYCKDKVLQATTTYGEGEEETVQFYYSAAYSVSENAENQWVVWPNPTADVLNLSGDLRQVEIFSIDGKLVMTFEESAETINLSGVAKGSYLLKATTKDGNVHTQRFIKQ